MTPEQVHLIQGTSDVLISIGSRVADHFYDELFRIAPGVRPLFPDDLTKQKIKLMETLAAVVGYVTHPEMFASVTRQVGRRHAGYGALAAHYGPVGSCLLASLGEVLGPRFTPEVRQAWAALYGEVAALMVAGQEEERARIGNPDAAAERGAAEPRSP